MFYSPVKKENEQMIIQYTKDIKEKRRKLRLAPMKYLIVK